MSMPISWFELALLLLGLGSGWTALARSLTSARQRSLWVSAASLLLVGLSWLESIYLDPQPSQGFVLLSRLLGPGLWGLDLLNLPLLALVCLLSLTTLAVTLKTRPRRFSFARTLLLQGLLLTCLSAQNPWVLLVCLALLTLPEIHELLTRGRSPRVFVLHQVLALLLLLMGWGLVTQGAFAGENIRFTGYALLTTGIAIRAGLLPAHCWLLDLFEQNSFGTALLSSAPLVAVYACCKLLLPAAPPVLLQVLAWLALLTALYTAAMGTVQREARRFICYFLLSQGALVLAGVTLNNALGLTASLFLWISLSMSVLALGLVVRCLEARTGRLLLHDFLGFYSETPTLAAFFLILGLASVGFPGTLGFFGLEMLMDASAQSSRLMGFVVVASAALNGIAVLRIYALIFLGKRQPSTIALRIRRVELAAFLAVVLVLVGGSVYPQAGVNLRDQASRKLLAQRAQQLSPLITAQR